MLHEVKFDDLRANKDLGLILSSRTISTPEIKKSYVKIPGADGSLDMTEAFGEVRYEDRTITLKFVCLDRPENFQRIFSKAQNLLHGQKRRISFDDDPDFYYLGRISVGTWTLKKCIGQLEMKIVCEPFKYWKEETVLSEQMSGSKEIRLLNLRKTVRPLIWTENAMTLEYNGKFIHSVANTPFRSDDIVLKEGENWLKVTGNGTIEIRYQQRSL